MGNLTTRYWVLLPFAILLGVLMLPVMVAMQLWGLRRRWMWLKLLAASAAVILIVWAFGHRLGVREPLEIAVNVWFGLAFAAWMLSFVWWQANDPGPDLIVARGSGSLDAAGGAAPQPDRRAGSGSGREPSQPG